MPSETLPRLLTQLDGQITNEEYVEGAATLDEIQTEYDQIEDDEAVLFERAMGAQSSDTLSQETRQELASFTNLATSIEYQRSSLLVSTALFFNDPMNTDSTEARNAISQLESSERDFVDAAAEVSKLLPNTDSGSTADDSDASVTIGPRVAFVDSALPEEPIPKGETFDGSVTVENVGDQPAEKISLSVSGSLSVSLDPEQFPTLRPNQRESVAVSVDATESGSFDPTIELRTPESDTSRTATVTVEDRDGFVQLAREVVTRLKTSLEGHESNDRRTKRAVISSLENALRAIERYFEKSDEGKQRPALAALQTARRQLGSALNHVEKDDSGSDDAFDASVTNQVTAAIERLSAAEDAER